MCPFSVEDNDSPRYVAHLDALSAHSDVDVDVCPGTLTPLKRHPSSPLCPLSRRSSASPSAHHTGPTALALSTAALLTTRASLVQGSLRSSSLPSSCPATATPPARRRARRAPSQQQRPRLSPQPPGQRLVIPHDHEVEARTSGADAVRHTRLSRSPPSSSTSISPSTSSADFCPCSSTTHTPPSILLPSRARIYDPRSSCARHLAPQAALVGLCSPPAALLATYDHLHLWLRLLHLCSREPLCACAAATPSCGAPRAPSRRAQAWERGRIRRCAEGYRRTGRHDHGEDGDHSEGREIRKCSPGVRRDDETTIMLRLWRGPRATTGGRGRARARGGSVCAWSTQPHRQSALVADEAQEITKEEVAHSRAKEQRSMRLWYSSGTSRRFRLPSIESSPSAWRCPARRSSPSRASTSTARLRLRLRLPRSRRPLSPRTPRCPLVRRRCPQWWRIYRSSLVPLPPTPTHVPVDSLPAFPPASLAAHIHVYIPCAARSSSRAPPTATSTSTPVRELDPRVRQGRHVRRGADADRVLGSTMTRSTPMGRTTRGKTRWWWTGRA
ncbi:hypothetical protein C8R45DRAFT_293200 [Mycena sanguinolenta]|nr:hypothetical protein C8R45DRAFT_293200 [Mycena sanguinolenta]